MTTDTEWVERLTQRAKARMDGIATDVSRGFPDTTATACVEVRLVDLLAMLSASPPSPRVGNRVNRKLGVRVSEEMVLNLKPGDLLQIWSDDPWFGGKKPSDEMPCVGLIVEFTGNVDMSFPKVGPHLEVRSLDGEVFAGGGWVYDIFRALSALKGDGQ